MTSVERAYLDHAATSPLRPEARDAMLAALARPANASSVHAEGRAARRAIEDARDLVLRAFAGGEVVFTSGGTEANNLALGPAWLDRGDGAPRERLFVSAVEHVSVLEGHRFPADLVERIPVGADGLVDPLELGHRIAASGAVRPLVSIQLASNETGVVQPIPALAEVVHAAGGLLHVDVVQAVGKLACGLDVLGADIITLAGHKFGGPHGAGALVLRDGLAIGDRMVRGGGQEKGARAGTENGAAIAGLAAALAATLDEEARFARRAAGWRDAYEAGVRAIVPVAVVIGAGGPRLPHVSAVMAPGLAAETAVIAFDLAGVAVSSGSACSSGRVKASHVLAAMGLGSDPRAGALRVSFGWSSRDSDVERALDVWRTIGKSLNKRAAGAVPAVA